MTRLIRVCAIRLSVYALVTTFIACTGALPSEPLLSLVLVAGDDQIGSVGEALPAPLVVKAVDGSGAPLSGVEVTWRVNQGGGSVAPQRVTTDAFGVAETIFTLGTSAGANTARAGAFNVAPVVFGAMGAPGPVAAVMLSSVAVDLGRTAQLSAEAWDEYGNAVTDEVLTWSSADPAVSMVDQYGEISPVAEGSTKITATSTDGPSASASLVVPEPPLRYLVSVRGFKIGSAVHLTHLENDATYSFTLDRQFNTATPEQVMKFRQLRPGRSAFDFSEADQFMDFAEAADMTVHGHALVWHHNLPDWLTTGAFTKAELLEILKDHILTVVGRYQGRIESWDVVNEAVDNAGVSLRSSFWLQQIGPEYIDSAYTWAAEADPQARLYYNDWGGEGLSTKSNTIFDLVSDLVAKGVPIHGVGLESHFELNRAPLEQNVIDNLKRIAGMGLDVRISELDVRIEGTPSAADLESQADTYRSILRACLTVPRCEALVMWGFTDKYSWIPVAHPGWGSATMLDEEFNPKPAYYGLFDELSNPQ